MLRKPFHGKRIKQEIQKWTAIRTPSSNLNPVRESPGSPIRPTSLALLSPLPPLFFYCQNFPPTSHFRFTHQGLSTSSLATETFYSRAREDEPNTHLEDPNINVKSLRESSNDRRENSGDGEGFCRRRTLPEERVLILTCVRENGVGVVYCFWTKHNSQELSKKEAMVVTSVGRNVASWELFPCNLGTIEALKWNTTVHNKLEVYPGDMYDVAMEELRKYGGQVMPLKEQLEVLGRRFRVAYEEAMKCGIGVMMNRHFPVQVALCDRRPLREKIAFIRTSLVYQKCFLRAGHEEERFSQARSSRLWRFCVFLLLEWIQSGCLLWTKEMKRENSVG